MLVSKPSLRKASLARREALTAPTRRAWSLACVRRLIRFVEPLSLEGSVIAGYSPIRSEVNVTPALVSLIASDRVAVLPRATREERVLRFYRWREGDELVEDVHGIPAPAHAEDPLIPSILIVPLLAFDRRLHRLGYGAGFYDATLAKLRETKPVIAIGVAFSLQETNDIPQEGFDQPLDAVVTEKEIIKA
jgi:5-formyltetrahydrofolate cyclo-ligase